MPIKAAWAALLIIGVLVTIAPTASGWVVVTPTYLRRFAHSHSSGGVTGTDGAHRARTTPTRTTYVSFLAHVFVCMCVYACFAGPFPKQSPSAASITSSSVRLPENDLAGVDDASGVHAAAYVSPSAHISPDDLAEAYHEYISNKPEVKNKHTPTQHTRPQRWTHTTLSTTLTPT